MSQSSSDSSDSKSRPFICPCGKNYLSYPALFTHIKQKHNGNAPGQIVRPRSVNKRGRPRKNLTDLPNDLLPPLPDYKNSANRPILKYPQADSPNSYTPNERQASTRPKLNCDFIPPIPTSHLSIIKNYHSTPQKQFKQPEMLQTKEGGLPAHLLEKLKTIFAPLSTGSYLPTASLEALIKSNHCYQQARITQRKNARRPLGGDKYEMQFRSAVLSFLQASEDQLSKRQFKNLEVLMSLLLAYYLQMVQNQKNITTQNYIKHINNFSKNLLQEVHHEQYYQNIFALDKQASLKLLEVFHQWLIGQKLSQHELQINPHFKVQEGYEHIVSANNNSSSQQAKVDANPL